MARVIAIYLDGYDHAFERQMVAAGELPALARLAKQSGRFPLDHGEARQCGISGEHVASGLDPQRAGRHSNITFNPATYAVKQFGALAAPFCTHLNQATVVFDVPYFDMQQCDNVRGIADWGAHDGSVDSLFRPPELKQRFNAKFGAYPAEQWHYSYVWPSVERTIAMAAGLANAIDLRAHATEWLLTEGVCDWQLALIGIGEVHSAIEGLWHGIDSNHPLHAVDSAPAAGEGVRNVYRAVDRLVNRLMTRFTDATFVVFTLHGMGSNSADTTGMLMLPELLFRLQFGRKLLRPAAPLEQSDPSALVYPSKRHDWDGSMQRLLPWLSAPQFRRLAMNRLPKSLWPWLDRRLSQAEFSGYGRVYSHLHWMPVLAYQPYWAKMKAFALPAFHDGRIRINLKGRERRGLVEPTDYRRVCDEITRLLQDCRSPGRDIPVVAEVRRNQQNDPLTIGHTEADLTVIWSHPTQAIKHPQLGTIGPVPFRRPGGHTGGLGMAYVKAVGVVPGDYATRSSFDVVPTLIQLLGAHAVDGLSGRSMLAPRQATKRPPLAAARRASVADAIEAFAIPT